MSFGKRVSGASLQPAPAPATSGFGRARVTAAPSPASAKAASAADRDQDKLVAELRAMARAGGTKTEKIESTIGGKLVKESGPGANPVLVERNGVARADEVRRSDYYASSAVSNLCGLVGLVGGVALGLSPQATLGATFVMLGLGGVATGRMLRGRAFSERVYMGASARLAGVGVMIMGGFLIYMGWRDPSVLGMISPDYAKAVGARTFDFLLDTK